MLHPIHQLVNLAGLHQLVDVGDGHPHQQVHVDETEAEDEEEEGEVGRDGELREYRHLLNIPTAIGQISDSQVLRELKVQVVNLPQHHHHHRHYRPGETGDVEMSLPGEEDGEHHHEADENPDVGNTEYQHFLGHRPEHGE